MPQQSDFANPRSSFVQPVVPPGVDPDAGPFYYVAVQVDWLPFVLGALAQLRMKSTWLTATDADNLLAVDRATLLTNIIAGPGVIVPGTDPLPSVWTRYNPGTGDVETSIDGGATWEPAPGADPRNQIIVANPATADQQCNSAASAVRYISRMIEEITDGIAAGATAAGIATGLVGRLAPLGFYISLFIILVDVAIALAAIGAGVIVAAMTSTVYDTLECIFYCRMSVDGFLTAAAMSLVLADIHAQLPGVPESTLTALFQVVSWATITNAGYLQLDTDTCAGCGCLWSHIIGFSAGKQGWTVSVNACGDNMAAPAPTPTGWSFHDTVLCAGTAKRQVQLQITFPATAHITSVSINYDRTAGTFGSTLTALAVNVGATAAITKTNLTVVNGSGKIESSSGSWSANNMALFVASSVVTTNTFSGAAEINSITVAGDGYDPFV